MDVNVTNNKAIKIFRIISLLCCLLFFNSAFAAQAAQNDETQNSNNQEQTLPPQNQVNNGTPVPAKNSTGTFSLNSSELGLKGPFSFGISEDSLLNFNWNAQYTQKFNDYFAISALIEDGPDMYRYGGTLGFALLDKGLFKISAENLSEVLPFDFDSGSVDQRVHQAAVGARYQYNFKHPTIWQDINFGGYYAHAPSKSLDPVQYTLNGSDVINYRYIAGANSGGVDIGSEFKITKYTQFVGHIYYDDINYNTIYTLDPQENAHGLGADVGINQLLGRTLLFSADISNRKDYNNYNVNISWLPPYLSEAGFEITLLAEYLDSRNQTPSSYGFGLRVGFSSSVIAAKKVYYQLPDPDTLNDISLWTNQPAVHMERVLAIADQQTKVLAPVISAISPGSGLSAGGTIVTITGEHLFGTTGVSFDGIPATSFSVTSNNTIICAAPPHAIGAVDLVVINPGGSAKTSFSYTLTSTNSKLSIKAVNPTQGVAADNSIAVVYGSNFVDGATVKFGSLSAVIKKISADQIVINVPQTKGIYGAVDVTVTNPDGTTVNLPNGFTYLNANDANVSCGKASMSPTSGPNPGGTLVTISGGAKYTSATKIDIYFPPNLHKTVLPTYVSADGTVLQFVTPSGGTGPAQISTINPTTSGQPFTFYYHPKDKFEVEASADSNTNIKPSGTTEVKPGKDLTYEITPKENYYIQDVLVDGASVGPVSSYTFTNIQADHTIYATSAINAYTINSSAGKGGVISPSGDTVINQGGTQAFAISPDVGYHIVQVLVDGVDQGRITEYTFSNVKANHTISATFDLNLHIITAKAEPNGTISPKDKVFVNYGDNQTFTITPNANYQVADVLVDGVSVGAVTSYTFNNVIVNHSIIASFTINTHIINATADVGGSITPAGNVSVDQGATQEFLISAAAGYHIKQVVVDDSNVGPVSAYTFTDVKTNHTIHATFAADTDTTITAKAGPNGTISPSGDVYVTPGGSQSFTINADANYHVADVLVDGESVGPVSSYTFNNVTTKHSITATFAINEFTITSSAGVGGSISPLGNVSVAYGGSQTFDISPNTGYHISQVLVDGVDQGLLPLTMYTFSNVTANHTISVTFAENAHIINASSGPNGDITDPGRTIVKNGDSKTYTMIPEMHHHVADVIVDGKPVGPVALGAPYTYEFANVQSDHTITATFGIDVNSISVIAGPNGSVLPGTNVSVNYGDDQTFSFIPDTGYEVGDVVVDGVSVGAVTSYTLQNVIAPHTIEVTFAKAEFTINASSGSNGKISPAGNTVVLKGSTETFTITPDTGFVINDVMVDGVSVGAVSSYVFDAVKADHTIYADFSQDIKLITPVLDTVSSEDPLSFKEASEDKMRYLGKKITVNLNKFVSPPTSVTINGKSAEIVKANTKAVTVILSPAMLKLKTVDVNISNEKESIIIQNMQIMPSKNTYDEAQENVIVVTQANS